MKQEHACFTAFLLANDEDAQGITNKGHRQKGQKGKDTAPNKHIPSRCPARADGHGIDGRLTGRRHVADPSSKPNEADDGTNGHRSLRQGLQDRKGHGTDHSRRNDIR